MGKVIRCPVLAMQFAEYANVQVSVPIEIDHHRLPVQLQVVDGPVSYSIVRLPQHRHGSALRLAKRIPRVRRRPRRQINLIYRIPRAHLQIPVIVNVSQCVEVVFLAKLAAHPVGSPKAHARHLHIAMQQQQAIACPEDVWPADKLRNTVAVDVGYLQYIAMVHRVACPAQSPVVVIAANLHVAA